MSTTARAAIALREFITPLYVRLSSLEGIESLVDRYGWRGPLDEPAYEKIQSSLSIITAIRDLVTAVDALPDDLDDISATAAADIAMRTLAVLGALNELVPPAIADLGEPYKRAELWESLAEHILDDLLAEYLRVHYPPIYLVLRVWGAIRYEHETPAGDHRQAYRRTQLDWDRVLGMIEEPLATLKNAYHWDDPAAPFDHAAALAVLADVLRAVHVPAKLLLPAVETPEPFAPGPGRVPRLDVAGLRAILREGVSLHDILFHRIGFDVFPASTAADAPPSGLVLRPVAEGGASMQLTLGKRFTLRWDVAASVAEAFGIAIFPDRVDIIGGDAAFGAKIELSTRDDGWLYLVGGEDRAHIALSGLTLGLAIKGTTSDAEVVARLATLATATGTGCRVSIPLADADGFVREVVDRNAIELKFAPEVLWSSKDGILFNGAPKLDIRLPAHIALGPVTIDHLRVSLGRSDGTPPGVALAVETGISAHIGPLDVLLEGLGVAATVTRHTRESMRANPDQKPSLGAIDTGFDFVPPRGFGLSIDTSLVKGGGYIERIPERNEYVGVAQLTVADWLSLKAFGLVTTKPDVSFLLAISSEFPPIQIGLGFQLEGVGGLVGIHRRLDADRLLAAVRDGAVDDILFPAEPLKDPHVLVDRLATLFPASRGRHLFGPTALITWGPKSLIKIKLAVVIEVPTSLRVAILGSLTARVRKRVAGHDFAILDLQINFGGLIDFDEKFIRFDASLFRSRLLGLELAGDAALRVRYGARPDFVLTLGGFHPDFQPPALSLPPSLQRLQITIASGNPHIWVDSYFAVTSNSIQFGASGNLEYKKWGVRVTGSVGFDALFQFDPFQFVAGVFLRLDASWKGVEFTSIEISGDFSGPSPWRIKGKFHLSICWFLEITIPIDESWGDRDDTNRGSIDVFPLLVADVSARTSWERETGKTHTLVTLRRLDGADPGLRVHPNELLRVRQNTVPLGVAIEKFAEQRPQGGNQFRLALRRGTQTVDVPPVRSHFAPAQFFERRDEEKLAAEAYKLFDAGADLTELDAVVFETWTGVDVSYEPGYVDDEAGEDLPRGLVLEPLDRFRLAVLNNARANSVLGRRAVLPIVMR